MSRTQSDTSVINIKNKSVLQSFAGGGVSRRRRQGIAFHMSAATTDTPVTSEKMVHKILDRFL